MRFATGTISALSLLLVFPTMVLAQQEETQKSRGPVIEEVFVTAQRKSEQIQDVPISMSALDGDFLREQGVADLQDVAMFVPNVRVDFAGNYIQPRVRGIATNTVVNRGLALPVGIVIDEMPYSRADYFASGIYDMKRVEVLRGPQGQLFGANTTVGLMNIVTENPSDEFSGSFSAEKGAYDRRRYEAALGGPLIADVVNFRVAGLKEEYGNYVKNTTAATVDTADEGFGERSRESIRFKLEFPDIAGGAVVLSYQYDDGFFGGAPREITAGYERWQDLLLAYDPNVDFEEGNLIGSTDSPTYRVSQIDTFALNGAFSIGEWGLNIVTGWSGLESETYADSDNSPIPANTVEIIEASSQTTFELRIASPDLPGFFGIADLFGASLGNTDFTAGAFYQNREQKPTDAITRLNAPLTILMTAQSSDPFFPVLGVLPPDKWEYFAANFEQIEDEMAVFGQFNWRFLEDWVFLAGIRVSEIAKEAAWVQTVEAEDGVCCLMDQLISSFTGVESNTERYTAPKLGLKVDLSDDINFYLSWAKGFQPGGFNNFSNSDSVDSRTVKPAYVESWELGSKMRLLDGAAELNVGLFLMKMEDFQLFTTAVEEGGGFLPIAQVTNVGALQVQGVEIDFNWLPTDWLSLRGSFGINDSEYLDFPIGTCFSDRPNTDGDSEARCDLTGEELTQAPKWEASFTPSIVLPLMQDISFVAGVGVQYTDDRYLHESNDPRSLQPAYVYVSGNLGIRNEAQGWSLGLRVENATDERYHNAGMEGIPAAGLAIKAPNPPRTVLGSFRWSF
ncbi:TonB-dependent receptor [Zhongshania sp.]|uniref:TonB-dependent receptor n=1 Tax=Zhongshania sp. TaxID=1971902 RepID=UPI00356707A1